MNPLLTPKQVARILNVSYRKVLELIILGSLPAFKIGSAYRIEQSAVHHYLESVRFKSGWKK